MDELPCDPAGVSDWTCLSETKLVGTPIFDLVSRRFRHPTRGTEGDFYVLKTRDWVNVLPVTPDKRVVMVKQFRFGIQAMSWEIPGGVMDAGEDPIEAGLRELREETGYEPSSTRMLGSVSANPAILDNRCHFVLADGVRPTGGLDWDEHEEIEVKLFALDEVYEMAASGGIVHPMALNALFHYYPEWLKHKGRRR